jgi:CHAD domain-containing protein
MYRRVLQEGGAITPASPAADLHELRKSCKKLRYLMEFFQSLFPAQKIRQLIEELKDLQDNLGEFQDLEVQTHTLREYGEQMTRDGLMQPRTQIAFDTLQEHLHTSTERVRNEFESRFRQFSSKPNRHRFKLLFHSENAK